MRQKLTISSFLNWVRRRTPDMESLAQNSKHAGSPPASRPENLFQEAYYRAMYPDADYGGGTPLEHYREKGWKEGKNPNPFLYSLWYMKKYPDAVASGLSPLDHYFQLGVAEGYDPSPRFSTRAYTALYPELGGENPLAYHFRFGLGNGNLCVRPSMAEKVLAACSRQYPDAWTRCFTTPFAPALAYGDERKAFDKSVQHFYQRLKAATAHARHTGDWAKVVSLACEGALGQVDFQRGIVAASQALAGWSTGVDSFAPSYFLFLVLKVLAACCPGGRDKLVASVPEGWRSHPGVLLSLALLALQAEDEERFSHLYDQINASYLRVCAESLKIIHIETRFAQGCSDDLPSWYYDLQGHYCCKPFERVEWLNDTSKINASFCCSLFAPFQITADEKTVPGAMWNSASSMEFRKSIVDGDYTYCSRSVCPDIIAKRLHRANEADSSLRPIQIFKDTGELPAAPRAIHLSLDWTCNLACPACRQGHYHPKPGEIEKLFACYEREIKPLLFGGGGHFCLDGAGEVLASKLGLHILDDFRIAGNPHAKLTLQSNGQLLTEKLWKERLAELKPDTITISIDAASLETYEIVRWPGKWATLYRNMEHLAMQVKAGNIEKLQTSFVIQQTNWREILDFAKLCKNWEATGINYFQLVNKAGYTVEHNLENNVLAPENPCFAEASHLLKETRRYCENNGIAFMTTFSG